MDTLVITTLLLAGIGLVAIVLDLSLGYLMPNHHKARPWVRGEETTRHRAAA